MIEKIVIKVGEKTIELTHEEVVNLRSELNQMFGQPYYPVYPTYPSYPTYPYWSGVDSRGGITYTSCQ